MITNNQIKNVLIKGGILSKEEFKKYSKKANESDSDLLKHIIWDKVITEEEFFKEASRYFKVPFIDLKGLVIPKEVLFNIPESVALTYGIIVFDVDKNKLKLAVLDPEDLEIFEFIKKKTELDLKIYLTTPESIKKGLKQYHGMLESQLQTFAKPKETSAEVITAVGIDDTTKITEDLPVIKIVENLLEYAIFKDASDIHIEPADKDIIVRYRIDGILHDVMNLAKSLQSGIISRIKILSNLKVDEHRLPQDGRFKFHTDKYKVSFRVSIIPTFDGEKIVMRILNEKKQLLFLENLGLQKSSLNIVKRNIAKPHGMILVTGPTGSGKTTTLYTILSVINTPKVNIATVEDPIEYRMQRVNQSQINPKIDFTFASGLRSLLRQDPDIIMVGEIRDEETAKIAVHAAMTGHLLFSTLHTNDAVTTLPRLSQIGIQSFLIASTTNLIISQRLVRTICEKCKKSFTLDKDEMKEMEQQFNLNHVLKKLKKMKLIKDNKTESLKFYKGEGCKACNKSGYSGRMGIYETLEITDAMSELILKKVEIHEIEKQAEAQGMITMFEDGFIKAQQGLTTMEEIMRVIKE